MAVRVCIADDHMLILSGIRTALEAADDVEVVGAASSGAKLLTMVDQERPDVVLLDHRMPGMDGMTCLKLIKERHPEMQVVMLSASEDRAQINEALAAGASAYIGKRINPEDLASVLRQVVAGVVYHQVAPVAGEAPEVGAAGAELTARERTMLEAVSRGLSTKEISRELWISDKTVKFHLTNMYRKLGVNNRAGAIRYAFENGLIPTPGDDTGVREMSEAEQPAEPWSQ